MALKDAKKQFGDMLEAELDELQGSLSGAKDEVAAYMAERADHLSTLVGEPGFDRALIAERNNVAMKAGLVTSDQASAFDQRIFGMIGGALRIAAVALV